MYSKNTRARRTSEYIQALEYFELHKLKIFKAGCSLKIRLIAGLGGVYCEIHLTGFTSGRNQVGDCYAMAQ